MKNKGLKIKWHYPILFLLLIATFFPFYMMVITSLKHKAQVETNFWGISFPFRFDNYVTAFEHIWPYITNSIIVTAGIVLGVIICAALAGYSFARFDYPGKNILFTLILALLMVPGFLILVPQFLLVQDLGMLNSYQGQMFPPMAVTSSIATLLFRTFFEGIPKSLFESAEMEGAGEFRILIKIVIPLSMPIIATVGIIAGMTGWNNYIWPLVSVSDDSFKPVIIILNDLMGSLQQGDGVQLAGFVIASLPLVIPFLFAARFFTEGLTSGSVKG